ncbi:50S ribosomal protein L21, mitochondrial [Canna indica]|uniref:Large ribosomal subunit protein bL21m n=1 Tax=Canna indica TaxID=4628 RepID=A0AAQ3KYD5_9LILI|nr:50S ribosomal protein L21, mitochondrial [Canna indica]
MAGGFISSEAGNRASLYEGRITSYFILACLVGSLGGALFGYDLGISSMGSGASLYSSIITGSMLVVGALVSMAVVDRLGRRFLFIEAGIQMIASMFLCPATSQLSLLNLGSTPGGSRCASSIRFGGVHHYCSRPRNSSNEEEAADNIDEEEEEEDEEGGESCNEENGDAKASKCVVQRGISEEDKVEEADEIGYKVIGPLDSSENPFKPYEPFFAVVQLTLNRVLMMGSRTETIVGRPIVPDAAVHGVVEEHALDAKVIIFKKKRRKNYRRTKGHRQASTLEGWLLHCHAFALMTFRFSNHCGPMLHMNSCHLHISKSVFSVACHLKTHVDSSFVVRSHRCSSSCVDDDLEYPSKTTDHGGCN